MPTGHASILALLRPELGHEAATGFPRLTRIPCTDIIWFLDHYAALDPTQQQTLLDDLADFDARVLGGWHRQGAPQEPATITARLHAERQKPGGQWGTRYTDVKMLGMDPAVRDPDHYEETWRQHFTPLHFQPRSDLLPDINHFTAAKAPLLRKLVDEAFRRLLAPDKKKVAKEKLPGGPCRYAGVIGRSEVSVTVDFGSYLGQVRYEVRTVNPEHTLRLPRLNVETLWGGVRGWDYLTEENAPRCIDFLADQVVYLVQLAERVNAVAAGGT